MSVVATLWDVTDRDIDRFSVRVGEQWGLFSPPNASTSSSAAEAITQVAAPLPVPKTPGTKRGQSRTTQPKTPATVKMPKSAIKGPPLPRTPGRSKSKGRIGEDECRESAGGTKSTERKMSLVEAVAKSRDACYLRNLNGAAAVVYGIPTYLSR